MQLGREWRYAHAKEHERRGEIGQIAGDRSVKYEVVLGVMDELQRQQVAKIGLLVQPTASSK